MVTINVATADPPGGFGEARRQAVGKAGEALTSPVIVAWKDDTGASGPRFPEARAIAGTNTAQATGGRLVLTVGDAFHFIFAEAADFEEPDLNLSSISEADGTTILCLNDACTEDGRRRMGHFAGGGIGG
jgi:hypothetical protein